MARVLLENICKTYPGGVKAVDNVDLEIHDREFVVLVGPSGCGKSTILRMIAGLEEVTSGNVSINGKQVNEVPPKDRDIAMVFQNYALYPHMTVYKNMAFGLMLRKYPKAEIDDRVREAAQILGITDEQLRRKPKALSGGQRQRVAVGRAIVRKPKAFLFDEPLSNLDAKMRVQMRAEISKLHQRLQATMIYVTHDQVEAMTMGDRIVLMKDGVIQQVDEPIALYDKPKNVFVAGFIGSPPMNFFKGSLEQRQGGLWFVEQAAGSSGQKGFALRVNHDMAKKLGGHVGKPIVFGSRPENISDKRHSSVAQPDHEVPVTVEEVDRWVQRFVSTLIRVPTPLSRASTRMQGRRLVNVSTSCLICANATTSTCKPSKPSCDAKSGGERWDVFDPGFPGFASQVNVSDTHWSRIKKGPGRGSAHAFEGAFCRDPRSEGRSTGYNCPKVSPAQMRFRSARREIDLKSMSDMAYWRPARLKEPSWSWGLGHMGNVESTVSTMWMPLRIAGQVNKSLPTRGRLVSCLTLLLLASVFSSQVLAQTQIVNCDAPVQSRKRGIAVNSLSDSDFRALAPGVSWYYNWGATPLAKPSDVVMDFIPMAWNGSSGFQTSLTSYLAAGNRPWRVFALNEPNLKGQAFMTPSNSAVTFKQVKAICDPYNIPVIAPHMAIGSAVGSSITAYDPIMGSNYVYTFQEPFLNAFLYYCGSTTPAGMSTHSYGGYGEITWILSTMHTDYPTQSVWLTEFNTSASSDAAALANLIPSVDYCERMPWVEGYSWFMSRISGDPYNSLLSGSGVLTAAGQAYVQMPVHDPNIYYRIPGRLQAERYVTLNQMSVAPTTDTNGLADMKSTAAGGSVDYNIQIDSPGNYPLNFRVAGAVGQIKVYNGATLLGTANTTQTSWTTVSTTVSLAVGTQTLHVVLGSNAQRLNWMEFLAANGVPSAPSGLNATAGCTQVVLNWSVSGGATSYNAKSSTTNGGPYSIIASPTTTSYTNTGLVSGTTYYYVVSAVNGAGESTNSIQVSATPTNSPPVLAAISNQTILAGRTLLVTNSASDPDAPPQLLTYSLPVAPTGASIDANSGLFTWRPAIAQSPSTQTVTVVVSDNGTPVLTATQSFTVTVIQPALPTLNAASLTNGQFGFWIDGNTGPDYTIQASTNLTSWDSIFTSNSPALPYFWVDTDSVSYPFRFYRVILGP